MGGGGAAGVMLGDNFKAGVVLSDCFGAVLGDSFKASVVFLGNSLLLSFFGKGIAFFLSLPL